MRVPARAVAVAGALLGTVVVRPVMTGGQSWAIHRLSGADLRGSGSAGCCRLAAQNGVFYCFGEPA